MKDKASILQEVSTYLSRGDLENAGAIIDARYPFVPTVKKRKPGTNRRSRNSKRPTADSGSERKYERIQALEICKRDGFIDRYSGERLVFIGASRLMSALLPQKLPWHRNSNLKIAHRVFWELWPAIDHVVPLAVGGSDDLANKVCTSMEKNSEKSDWTLEELDWKLLPGGDLEDWDGLVGWFMDYCDEHPQVLKDISLLDKCWRAVRACDN